MSLNSLFKQIEVDLRRHNPRLENHLDALCKAYYQRDFNFISVARAFSMLNRFAKNNPNCCDAIKAHRSFVPRMMQVAQQQMQGNLCNARSFANLLYGCMNLGITPDAAWQTTFWQNSQDKLNDFNPQALSSTLYAAAKLSLTPPEDWQQAFWTQGKHQLKRFNPQNYSNTLHAAAKLSLTPPEDWQKAFWTQSQTQLKDFSPQGLSNTLYAACILKLKIPEDWQKAFWTQSKRQLRQFNPQDMINMLYAACVLDLKIPETVKPLVQSTVTSNTEEDIRHLHAMYSAKDYLEAQGINLVFKENTPEKLRQSEDTHVSQLEKKPGSPLQRYCKACVHKPC